MLLPLGTISFGVHFNDFSGYVSARSAESSAAIELDMRFEDFAELAYDGIFAFFPVDCLLGFAVFFCLG